ncbi:class F sortase [Blastococcus sp. LR1]|uniref:class F sortase n=1 Tax=Blastococcus sp. LR1 TaxID=2877000 RepID=UPI001CC964B9|nr:class F sortase [Blastococcus sp. LR1]MCA0144848.1 class F sortase [Blastococcus sp. LR1]
MTIRSAAVGAALGLLLTGCGSGPEPVEPAPQAAPTSTTAPAVVAAAPVVGDPDSVTIPDIGVQSSLVPLGLTETNEHEVPPVTAPEQAGWYEPGPEPGQIGPAIILGHVNGSGRPGVFARLAELEPGDEIVVDAMTFVVTEVQHADKDAFPADRVYADTDSPELRVITCGGVFDAASNNYQDNIIVYADLV